MGWTYEQYLSQPAWITEKIKMVRDLNTEYRALDTHFNEPEL